MGAKARLSRETLVSSALQVADDEGLDAVTTRRLAQQHNVTPMALYRHFRDKEQILDAIAERLLAEVELPAPDGRPWHEQMLDLCDAVLAALRPHPTAANLVLKRTLTSAPGLALTERTLGLLSEAGFPVGQGAETASQTLHSLVMLVITEPGRDSRAPLAHDVRDELIGARRAFLASLPADRYPHVVAAAEALVECASDDNYYARGTAMIVAGMRSGPLPAGTTAR